MLTVDFLLLYVEDVARSAQFYARLLEAPILEQSPGFALLSAGGSLKLGLWRRGGVSPAPQGAPGASEIAISLPDDAAVDALHAKWSALGAPIAQAPVKAEFGYNFVALDPDGHRLRAFRPE